jgi:DNA-binding transcriptional LysR family regulator
VRARFVGELFGDSDPRRFARRFRGVEISSSGLTAAVEESVAAGGLAAVMAARAARAAERTGRPVVVDDDEDSRGRGISVLSSSSSLVDGCNGGISGSSSDASLVVEDCS